MVLNVNNELVEDEGYLSGIGMTDDDDIIEYKGDHVGDQDNADIPPKSKVSKKKAVKFKRDPMEKVVDSDSDGDDAKEFSDSNNDSDSDGVREAN